MNGIEKWLAVNIAKSFHVLLLRTFIYQGALLLP